MNRRSLLCSLLCSAALTATAYASWNRVQVGTAPNVLNQLCVGDGRNDGVQRVYAVCEDGHLYEWTFSAGVWIRSDMGDPGGTGWCLGIALGRGRNDGINRLYMTRINGHVYEYTYSGGAWVTADLGSPNASLYGVLVGPGRNDGINRVYACGDQVPTVEYTRVGSVWEKDTVQAGQRHWLPDIGPGRNDGVNRLYCPNGMGNTRTVTEYTWSGSAFSRSDLPVVAGNPLSVFVGRGRNDGIDRVYASSRSKAYEFTYSGSIWQTADILPSYGTEERYDIFLGQAKSDGRLRAYVTCSGSQLLETYWDGAAWRDSAVDAVSSATCGVSIGRGRNDDTFRVYGCNRNGEVYEFTCSSPYVSLAEEYRPPFASRTVLYGRPNPFGTRVSIGYHVVEPVMVDVSIYDIAGQRVKTLIHETQIVGAYVIGWDGSGESGRPAADGVYIVRLNRGDIVDEKILVRIR